jgi:hypothetical protein
MAHPWASRLCSALLVLACWPGLVARFAVYYGSLFPMVSGSLFPVIVFACTVNLLVSNDVLFFICIFLTIDKKRKRKRKRKSSQ